MLLPGGLTRFAFTYDNYGSNPATTVGTLVTASATPNAEGGAAVLASSANLSQDICLLELWCHTSSGTGDRQILMDIGIDPAGGTSYTYVLSNIVVGNVGAVTTTGGGVRFLFPLCIKSGSQVAARIQCSQASITMRVAAKFYGRPSNPLALPRGAYSETIGTITNSSGQSFTPGNAADGSWTSLGTTARRLWWWQLAFSVSNATITAEYCYVDLAYGDGSNKHVILRALHGGTTGETIGDLLAANMRAAQCYCDVPAGSTIYIRGRANNAPDTGYNGVAIGIGG